MYLLIRASKSSSNQKKQKPSNYSSENKYRVTISTPNYKGAYHDDEDDLATFSIYSGYGEEKSENTKQGEWISAGTSITINGREITRGNFYYGGRLPSSDGYGTEASLVDDSLSAGTQPHTYEDASLGYWPKYISVSAECRGAYLNWLASDRDDPSTPLGYVFLYFYGLERRIVVDSVNKSVSDTEFNNIFEEIIRLKDIYHESHSFLRYSTRLLEIMCVLRPSVVSFSELEKDPTQDSVLLRYRLAKTVGDGKPIPSDLAIAWLKYYPEYSLRTPARRCSFEFGEMFSLHYKEKYGDGITVKPNKTRLKIDYWPASSTLCGIDIPQEDLPDPCNLKGPLNNLIAIAEDCTTALEAYSRYLGKKDNSRTDITATLLLPDELCNVESISLLRKFAKWAESNIFENGGLVDVNEFWQITNLPTPEKITKKDSELIHLLADKAGYGVVPDIRYHYAKPSVDGKLVLFKDGHGKNFKPSNAFNETGMALRLGAMVATIDAHLDPFEVSFLNQLIEHNADLSPVEKRSLSAYLLWRLKTPANVTGLKKRIEQLGSNAKAAVNRILIGVALADGKIDPEEVKQLEKLYSLLGLDKTMVTRDLHSLSAGRVGIGKSTLPTPDQISGQEGPREFHLDESILAIHESQTKDVQNMLGAIFVEDVVEDEASKEVETQIDQDNRGIDNQHLSLFEILIDRDKWSRQEMDELCKSKGLMTNGAIETINDWSFEKVDAPVLEEDADVVHIDQEIVEELEY